jgi:hypothetical protein
MKQLVARITPKTLELLASGQPITINLPNDQPALVLQLQEEATPVSVREGVHSTVDAVFDGFDAIFSGSWFKEL